ncbi:unannotated protein [freshwater metagenome]|uniref:Unannotated protein n=1 Tax=freshwater metagenome TaxID=449393 RepID=A0A6J7JV48_9ZZZZ
MHPAGILLDGADQPGPQPGHTREESLLGRLAQREVEAHIGLVDTEAFTEGGNVGRK